MNTLQATVQAFTLRPVYQREAFAFIDRFHRHHDRPQGWLFGTSAVGPSGEVVGVICVGRRLARQADNVFACEATRVCVVPGIIVHNRRGERHAASVCSMLYAAAWRASREIGYRSMTTYLLEDEPGVTLKALKEQGWRHVDTTPGGEWGRPSRHRESGKHPTGPKQIWRVEASAAGPATGGTEAAQRGGGK